ncbi:RDD family protein [Novosphingobium pentaromativorans]|uniref:RDD family protein n=1 Tax=Novosphingobium pentaromativorans US6-1 TaxID=1088721 RepID=G6EB47_9SPHN|nr:RDD domain-containing protein [Novosphingobium pentaromativorans US6-1]EHJ61514.1 RDD family protein [Novosphingobium pentaromativorans US6-1]
MTAMPTRLRRSSRDRVLVTPEGIALPVTVASRGARAGALMLDLVFIFLLILGSTMALFSIAGGASAFMREVESDTAAGHVLQFIFIVWIVILFLFRNAYFLFFELGPRGATPGKRLAGIRIAARDGGRLSAEMVIARNLLRDVELFLPLVFLASAGVESGAAWLAATGWFLIFMLFPMFNRDGLRAGDIIAGSWVLERPRQKLEAAMSVARGAQTAVAAPHRKYHFDDAELAVYGEYELQALERVLRGKRDQSIESVYQTIAAKIGRNDGWNDERRFLEAYYTQLRARLEAGMRMGRRKADKFSDEG